MGWVPIRCMEREKIKINSDSHNPRDVFGTYKGSISHFFCELVVSIVHGLYSFFNFSFTCFNFEFGCLYFNFSLIYVTLFFYRFDFFVGV